MKKTAIYILTVIIGIASLCCNREKNNQLDVIKKYIMSERYEDTIKEATSFIEKYPDEANMYYQRGWASLALNKATEAEKDFTQCVKIDKENSNGYKGLAMIAGIRSDFALSEMYYGKAIDKAKNDVAKADLYSCLAYTKLSEQKTDDALKLYDDAIKLNKEGSYHTGKAMVYAMTGQNEKVENELTIALSKPFKENRLKAHTLYLMAQYDAGRGGKKAALSWISKALEIDPTNKEFAQLLQRIKTM